MVCPSMACLHCCRALSNVADEGLLTDGFFWIPSLAGPTTVNVSAHARLQAAGLLLLPSVLAAQCSNAHINTVLTSRRLALLPLTAAAAAGRPGVARAAERRSPAPGLARHRHLPRPAGAAHHQPGAGVGRAGL